MSWWVYIIHADDDSLYTGISTDIERRFKEHCGEVPGKFRGAKYFYGRKPLKVVYREELDNQSLALRREYEIKQLNHADKLRLISNGC